MPELQEHGRGKSTWSCPVCGGHRRAIGPPGMTCYDCGYYPGANIKRCLVEKAVREMEEQGIILKG